MSNAEDQILEKKEDNIVKFTIIKNEKNTPLINKKIIETHFEKTKKPKDSKYLGQEDHIAKKEQKYNKKHLNEKKSLDPGKNNKKKMKSSNKIITTPNLAPKEKSTEKLAKKKTKPKNLLRQGTLEIKKQKQKTKTKTHLSISYGKLPSSFTRRTKRNLSRSH